MATIGTRTKHPVVLIHGVFGYGRRKPLWNTWSPYWPEDALDELNDNHLIVDVGALSSDHDRACEAFYQLYGGCVDYGEEHSCAAGHDRYGATFGTPLHPNWSAAKPVHLVGHSFGATTAIELYQLICTDAFGVGSSYEWVVSITSIAGPLSGTTLTHLFGLHEARMREYTLGHFIGSALGVWFKLQTDFPIVQRVFDFRMPQWKCVNSYREVLSAKGRINMSADLAVYNILPALRLERNSRLVHMDKVFLTSVTTSNNVVFPVIEITLGTTIVLFMR
uniref:Lipase-like C-terminal domain-containing protein n=1 Tax=Globisporangium ultimum (strain ATCC 200006 / CBS 805.95 / DAOM BR144) TaxID=431595 RepID=K3WXL4_GLOUD